jgi:N-methylhydantoinase B/oxoprolinase/acetone carboxylase alpha subunit
VAKGSTLTCRHAGGGGYFDPREREPKKVLEDVLDGYVSVKSAEKDYGVAIDPQTMTLNPEKTARLRKRA